MGLPCTELVGDGGKEGSGLLAPGGRVAVLLHGVLRLVALRGASDKEAILAEIIGKTLETLVTETLKRRSLAGRATHAVPHLGRDGENLIGVMIIVLAIPEWQQLAYRRWSTRPARGAPCLPKPSTPETKLEIFLCQKLKVFHTSSVTRRPPPARRQDSTPRPITELPNMTLSPNNSGIRHSRDSRWVREAEVSLAW